MVGFCGQGSKAKVARALPHFGEEPPLCGSRGAGTIFFSGCALRCLYCQNYQISQEGIGEESTPEELARLFLDLQRRGCPNLDLVSPTPHLPFILSALEIAISQGFCLPLVYNTHGYLSKTALHLLEGIVDIYLPDMKYNDPKKAFRLSHAEDYPFYNQAAVREMYRQVGPLQSDDRSTAFRGLLVRHLVLPENQSNSREVLGVLASISPEIPLSLMAQYRPCYRAHEVPEITRSLRPEEYEQVIIWAEHLDFEEIFIQDADSSEVFNPDFTREDPFV